MNGQPGAKVAAETLHEELKRYVRFGPEDEALLAALRPHAAPHFEGIAARLHERAAEHDEARAVLAGPEQAARLRITLVRWLDRLLGGPHDEAYFRETAKIGRAHVRVGLPQRYMLTAMALVRRELCDLAEAHLGARAKAAASAVDRALDIELAVMLETYCEAFVGRIESEKVAAVSAVAAGLAHEIRNPLNGAKLHVTFLERGLSRAGADPEMLEALRTVHDEIARLGGLVTDFLDFAQPRRTQPAATSLRALCLHAAQSVRPEAAAAGVRLEVDVSPAELVVSLDAAKIEQAILHLTRNAIESAATLSGGALVSIRARRNIEQALLEVRDNGPGVAQPAAPIFDPFFSTKPRGTGLGLAIVQRIVADHGGTISFDSRPGHTVFRVSLPID